MTWTCHICGTLATTSNALVLNGGPIVHRDCAPHPDEEAECDGLCVYAADIGIPSNGVAYPHPGCPLHDPDQVCECGTPDRCLSPTHGQISMQEALQIRHHQGVPR